MHMWMEIRVLRRKLKNRTQSKDSQTQIPDKIVSRQGAPDFPECSFEQQSEDFASSPPEGFSQHLREEESNQWIVESLREVEGSLSAERCLWSPSSAPSQHHSSKISAAWGRMTSQSLSRRWVQWRQRVWVAHVCWDADYWTWKLAISTHGAGKKSASSCMREPVWCHYLQAASSWNWATHNAYI